MPIKGLTTKSEYNPARGYPRMGKLRKGGAKTERKPGADLDYFRITLNDQYSHLQDAVVELYGEKPKEINIQLLGRTVEEVFPTNFESRMKSTIMHLCDGENQSLWYDTQANRYCKVPIPCIKPQCDCKAVGRLNFMLPQLGRLTGEYGAFVLETHSVNDISGLFQCLSELYRVMGDQLMHVPVTLGRGPREITFFNERSNQRVTRSANLIYVKYMGRDLLRYLQPELPDAPEMLELGTGGMILNQETGIHMLPAPSKDGVIEGTEAIDEQHDFDYERMLEFFKLAFPDMAMYQLQAILPLDEGAINHYDVIARVVVSRCSTDEGVVDSEQVESALVKLMNDTNARSSVMAYINRMVA